ncbi:MAG: N-6 DNA methylase, partial [Candidatus Binatia bacterium]
MAIKKSELYSSLWKSCDELRGGMDASQYKDYVLVLLFVKYVSDKYSGQKDALLVVPEGGSFADMVAAKGDKEIGDKMNKIIAKLAEANNLGVITEADFNNEDKLGKGKEMVDRLSNLVGIFENPALDFRSNRAEGDDILGDAYEYLMRHFATESGKSKGQFYTPAEVSIIMSRVIGIGSATRADQSIHDLTCGSGSLLIKAHDEAKSRTGLDLAIYGQEMDNATAALARMNMILHGCPTAEIWKDNVLSAPHFKERDDRLKLFDFIVANPPFSFKAWSTGFNPAHDEYGRFEFGVPPAKNGDYAFLLHVLTSLKSTGKAAVNLPHGVLFRGGAEADIRRNIVRRGYIKGIIERGRGMGLKPGYKQTEVGVIPAEWEVKPLGDVVDFLDGKRRPVKDSDRAKMRGDIPYYGASGVVDYVNDFLFDEDLILLGEHGENIISRNCRLAFKVSGKTWVNNHAHVLRPRQGMSLDYLAEFLEGLDYAEHNTGTAQPKLNKLVCSQIPVLRPPLPEQRTIAAALSDVDALISAQDKLIAKKRDLKQAAMQQLLTGKQRLPGFSGEWEVKQLGEIAEIVMGQSPSSSNYNAKGLGLPLIQGNADIADRKTTRRIFTTEITKRGKCGDILMSVRAPVGEISRAVFDVCLGRGVCAIRYANDFLYHYLISEEPSWAKLSKGST